MEDSDDDEGILKGNAKKKPRGPLVQVKMALFSKVAQDLKDKKSELDAASVVAAKALTCKTDRLTRSLYVRTLHDHLIFKSKWVGEPIPRELEDLMKKNRATVSDAVQTATGETVANKEGATAGVASGEGQLAATQDLESFATSLAGTVNIKYPQFLRDHERVHGKACGNSAPD